MLSEEVRAQEAVIGPEARARVEAQGPARVVVYLDLPDRPQAPAVDAPAPDKVVYVQDLSANVRAVQDEVLAQLGPGDFTLSRRFQTVPALAGLVSAAGLQRLGELPQVRRVDLDEGGEGTLVEAKALTRADRTNELGFTGEGISVAVLDSGVDRDHPDLQDDLGGEACFCSGGCCPNGLDTQSGAGAAEDDHGHGTNVIGIITSAGTVAPSGVAPDATILPVKVLDSNNAFCCSSDIVAGLDWVMANHASDVQGVSMSLGTFSLFSGDCDDAASFTMALRDAIEGLRSVGILSFAASGNDGSATQMSAPACIAEAISVGAVDDADEPTSFSNSNSVTDLFAPGVSVTSTGLGGSTSTFSGTSMATPHVAGCVADLLQADGTSGPDAIEKRFEDVGVTVTDPKNALSFPRVDCLAVLSLLEFFIGEAGPDGRRAPGGDRDVQ